MPSAPRSVRALTRAVALWTHLRLSQPAANCSYGFDCNGNGCVIFCAGRPPASSSSATPKKNSEGKFPGSYAKTFMSLRRFGTSSDRQYRRHKSHSSGRAGRQFSFRAADHGRCFRRAAFACGLGGCAIMAQTVLRLFIPAHRDFHQILVRNFPAEMAVLPALFKNLFEEDGPAGIRHKYPRCGKQRIACAVMHFHPTAQERGVTCHAFRVSSSLVMWSIVPTMVRPKTMWKTRKTEVAQIPSVRFLAPIRRRYRNHLSRQP
jgi:hypothetical protein